MTNNALRQLLGEDIVFENDYSLFSSLEPQPNHNEDIEGVYEDENYKALHSTYKRNCKKFS